MKHALIEVGTLKRNYRKPKVIRVYGSKLKAWQARERYYRTHHGKRIWIVSRKGALGTSYSKRKKKKFGYVKV